MPIRDFQYFKSLKNSFAKKPSRLLTNEKLIIDGPWFVRKYEINKNNLAPFKNLLESYSGTEIIWIWNGIKPKRAFYTDFAICTVNEIKNGNFKGANRHFSKFLECYDIRTKNYINEELKRRNIKCITAPYLAMAQAISIQQNIKCYYFGPTDYLLFQDAEKLITEFYFDTNQIEIFYKNEICKTLILKTQKFQELVLLFGTEFCPTIPTFCINFLGQKVIEQYKNMPIVEIIKKKQDIDKEYLLKYFNALNYLRYCPVMTENGLQHLNECTTQNRITKKINLSEIFGQRMREDFYEKMFLGEISPDIFEMFVYKENRENDIFANLCMAILENNPANKMTNEKENIDTKDLENLSINQKTVKDFIRKKISSNITFIDKFPIYYQAVLYIFLSDNKTLKLFNRIILAYISHQTDIASVEKDILPHFLRFFKHIKFSSELIEMLKSVCNFTDDDDSKQFDLQDFKSNVIRFLKANNKERKYDFLITGLNNKK